MKFNSARFQRCGETILLEAENDPPHGQSWCGQMIPGPLQVGTTLGLRMDCPGVDHAARSQGAHQTAHTSGDERVKLRTEVKKDS